VLLAASDGGWGGTRPGAASRTLAAMLRRWLVFQRPGGADEPDQELILCGTNRTYEGGLLVLPAQRLMPSATGVVHLVVA